MRLQEAVATCAFGWGVMVALAVGWEDASAQQLRRVHTQHLGQWTGPQMRPSLGLTGTDLGVSFLDEANPGQKRLIFLFGDSWTTPAENGRWDADSAAWVSLSEPVPSPGQLPRLNWFTEGNGVFRPFRIAERADKMVSLQGMEVPVEGVSIGQNNYVFFSTGWNPATNTYCCSIMTVSEGPDFDPRRLRFLSRTTTAKFINISAFVKDGTVWIFGSGPYRASTVYLARASVADFPRRDRWEYFNRVENGEAKFETGEHKAEPVLFSWPQAKCVGELSVRPNEQYGFLMLFTCGTIKALPFVRPGQERGVHLLRADNPWGPWDKSINLLNPDVEPAYRYFMHLDVGHAGYDDGLAEPGRHTNLEPAPGWEWREERYGGEYGAYQIPQWSRLRSDGAVDIYYTLSSWNPYQVHLMRTTLARRDDPGPSPPPAPTGATGPTTLVNGDWANGVAGWSTTGDGAAFQVFVGSDGVRRLTTYTAAKKESAKGELWQDFTVAQGTESLRFRVHGGEGQVQLYRGSERIRATRGRSGHEPRNEPDTQACWNIGWYTGQKLRLVIADDVDDAWGFVGVTRFDFRSTPCEATVAVPQTRICRTCQQLDR